MNSSKNLLQHRRFKKMIFRLNLLSIVKKKCPENILGNSSQKIKINLPPRPHYIQIPWIQWKKHSCRIDTFLTLAYHLFYYEFGDLIFPPIIGPKLPNELHPLGNTLIKIDNANNVVSLQKAVYNYVLYRSCSKNEKPGKGAAIFSLFSDFQNLPQFTWKFPLQSFCSDCKTISQRNFTTEPVFTITTFLLESVSGICSLAIKETLSNY